MMLERQLSPPRLSTTTRDELSRYLAQSWELTDWLFSSIADESLYARQPDPLRNPLVFYLGHPAAFYVNKLRLTGLLDRPLDDELDELLARGVDPAKASELEWEHAWPSHERVRRYRELAREVVESVLRRAPESLSIDEESPYWALLMACEHERIHVETSSVLLRHAPLAQLREPAGWSYASVDGWAHDESLVQIEGCRVSLGRPADADFFGWDNELGSLAVAVAPFTAARTLVSNAAFARFVEADGYRDPRYWSEGGWRWRCEQDAQMPRFWRATADGIRYRAMFREIPLPASWPVEVNCFEAQAYCAYRGDGWRLPSEAEQVALGRLALEAEPDSMTSERFNLNLRVGSPRSVDADPSEPIADAFGNVWQWLRDDFYPLPGFRPHRLYEDFSSPYFGPAHKMMLGGSWATTGSAASRYYRLWFRPYFYQHAGFRLTRSAS